MKKQREKTEDSLFDGGLICFQHKNGYRFSLDAVLLAHFVTLHKKKRLLDLGTGCGIIPLILHHRHAAENVSYTGIERQPELAKLAKENAQQNNFTDKISIIRGDVCDIKNLVKEESFEQIVCNPPFYQIGAGRTSKKTEADLARHQHHGGLELFLRAGFFALANRGKAAFIYPAEQICEFITSARSCGLEVKRMRLVYGYSGIRARLALFSCVKNGQAGLEVEPPLFVYTEKNGEYTDEVKKMYSPSSQDCHRC